MTVPPSVQIGPVTYRISADADSYTSLVGDSPDVTDAVDEGACAGMTCAHTQVIILDHTMGIDQMRVIMLHELMHAVADLASLGDGASEEDWCSRAAPYLLDILRRNADMAAFLLG